MRRIIKKLPILFLLLLIGFGVRSVLNSHLGEQGAYIVVLDPGHGGSDPGAIWEGVCEKDLNLSVALLVRELLETEEGIQILMTREDDSAVGLYDRAGFSNQEEADLFISIHSNALENDHGYEGILTFYHEADREGKRLADLLQAHVVAQTGGVDRGIRAEDYAVVRETQAPACLLEMGFMTTDRELERLLNPEYQQAIAQGVARGILAYKDD